jgi:hypothetical protein
MTDNGAVGARQERFAGNEGLVRGQVWELLDGPTGRMRIFRVVIPN